MKKIKICKACKGKGYIIEEGIKEKCPYCEGRKVIIKKTLLCSEK